jgi:Mg2+-importing ATPase
VLSLLGQADPTLARSLPLIFKSLLFQLAIVLLDATTVWILIRSLGEAASPAGVFASFMVSTLLRTISIVPGGLGIFEAASVVTLKLAGVAVPVALAATLLFRGLSFWLPMLPGLAFSRGVRKAT